MNVPHERLHELVFRNLVIWGGGTSRTVVVRSRGCGGVISPLLQNPSVFFRLVGKSRHNDHGLSVILERIELVCLFAFSLLGGS